MNDPTYQLDIFTAIIFLGVVQGLFLSYFFLNKRIRRKPSSLYLGFIMLSLSLIIFEIFLNHTGYMFNVLRIDNFSEPLNFAIPPLMYFYIYASITRKIPRRVWIHLLPLVFWAIYSIWYYIQPIEMKQLHYLDYHNPGMNIQLPDVPYHDDPLGLRKYVNELVMLQLTSYLIASIIFISRSFRSLGISFFAWKKKPISWLRNFIFLMFAILVTFVLVKSLFQADIGDYLIGSLIAFVIYATSFNVIRVSDFFRENIQDPLQPRKKYEKSALQEEEKAMILQKLKHCMEIEKDFKNPLVSLPSISRKLNTSVHHISQVINEKLGQTFFEMIALYRIEEAKLLLKDPSQDKLTIEDIADEVGYNSKSAFNRSFKKHTGLTPSTFRDSD
jgi:AraC-like DNA-binding protein